MMSSSVGNPPQQTGAAIGPVDGLDWPADVDLVLSALEAGGEHDEQRRHPRLRHRVAAELRLFSDTPGAPPWRLYTRDTCVRGIGFVTRDRLPLGYGGVVNLTSPNGRPVTVNGTLFRCRDIGNGWFEGALYFNREQWMFGSVGVE
ncbi:MAG: hypothetical protein ABIP55_15460 [Tepidisphaeraceae bacterium]